MANEKMRRSSQRRHRRARVAAPAPRRATQPVSPAEKRRARQRVLLGLYGLLGVEVVAALLTSPVFAVRRTELRGLSDLPSAEAAGVQHTAEIQPGTNWFRCPVGAVAQRLNALPCVQTVEVRRTLRNGVEVRVTPRRPEALVKVGRALYEVTRDGIPVRLARKGLELPLIALRRDRPVVLGQSLADPAFDAALGLYTEAVRETGTRVPIAKIEVDSGDNLCLNMHDGVRIELGLADELPDKLTQIRRIYEGEPDIARRVAAINLSCPSEPACTLRSNLPPAPVAAAPGKPESVAPRPADSGKTG